VLVRVVKQNPLHERAEDALCERHSMPLKRGKQHIQLKLKKYQYEVVVCTKSIPFAVEINVVKYKSGRIPSSVSMSSIRSEVVSM
jgi:hypothetical protein